MVLAGGSLLSGILILTQRRCGDSEGNQRQQKVKCFLLHDNPFLYLFKNLPLWQLSHSAGSHATIHARIDQVTDVNAAPNWRGGNHLRLLPAIIMPAPPRISAALTIGETVSLC